MKLKTLDTLKESTVIIGINGDNGFYIKGSGFFIESKDKIYLTTSKHIVYDKDFIDNSYNLYINQTDGKVGVINLREYKSSNKINWIFHNNENVDVALLPFPIINSELDLSYLSKDIFYSNELFELDSVFFIGYQPNIDLKKKINPLIRSGVISKKNADKTYYADMYAFPGNSGSPVFFKSRFFDNADSPKFGFLLGMIGQFVYSVEPVLKKEKIEESDYVFRENTGLGKVWPVNYILDILNKL